MFLFCLESWSVHSIRRNNGFINMLQLLLRRTFYPLYWGKTITSCNFQTRSLGIRLRVQAKVKFLNDLCCATWVRSLRQGDEPCGKRDWASDGQGCSALASATQHCTIFSYFIIFYGISSSKLATLHPIS
jgi:hypothetical protein